MTMNGDYELQQTLLLQIINKLWGPRQASETTVDNDKLRLFGVLFLEQNTEKLYRLHTGPSKRDILMILHKVPKEYITCCV